MGKVPGTLVHLPVACRGPRVGCCGPCTQSMLELLYQIMAKLKHLKKSLGPMAFEDVAQEAFLQSMAKAFGKDYFEKYLHRAMVNIALNSLRRTNREEDLAKNLKSMLPLVNLESLDLICDVHRIFRTAEYTNEQVHACYLYFCANFSLREVVKIYGKSHTEWRRFFNKTRMLFRKELSDYRFIPTREEPSSKGSNRTISKRN